jgi:sterol desaturase/sphingolipid hydroxylase (fatty acid hydroxylase superfamily)
MCTITYIFYIILTNIVHILNHSLKKNIEPLKFYREFHNNHHKTLRHNFGAFTPFCDIIFNTYLH